jgi:hypothetical protein
MEPALARPEPRRFRRGRRLQGGAHKTPFQLPGAHGLRFAKQWAPMFSAFFRPRTGQGRLAPCAKRPVDEDTCWFGPRPGAWARLSFEPARYPFFVCRLRSRTPRTPVVVSFGGIDRAVGAEVIERLQPLSIEAVLAAADMQRVEFALEQSRFEAARARWQYDAVDPDNRS